MVLVYDFGQAFGWWGGGSSFHGNAAASQSGKNVPSAASSASKDPCANATLAAAGVNARQQIATAQSYILNSAGPFGDLIAYGVAVNTGGPLDIKNLPGHSPQNPTDVAAGNISFGITCPFGSTFCQVSAGLAQGAAGLLNQISGGRYGHGAPGPASTYFDSPSDNAQIKVGQSMRAAGCHE